jgi:hypothetical protein
LSLTLKLLRLQLDHELGSNTLTFFLDPFAHKGHIRFHFSSRHLRAFGNSCKNLNCKA